DLAGAWLALLGFSLQICFDFSGYTDMAIGLGRLFGIELPRNFDTPLQGDVASGVLAALAHDPVVLAARLPLHSPRRQPLLAGAAARQRPRDDGAGRALARRRLDLRRVGRLARGAVDRPRRAAVLGARAVRLLAAEPDVPARDAGLGVLPRREL